MATKKNNPKTTKKAPAKAKAPVEAAAPATNTVTNEVSVEQTEDVIVLGSHECSVIAKKAIEESPDEVAEICNDAEPHEYLTVLTAKLQYGTISPEDLA